MRIYLKPIQGSIQRRSTALQKREWVRVAALSVAAILAGGAAAQAQLPDIRNQLFTFNGTLAFGGSVPSLGQTLPPTTNDFQDIPLQVVADPSAPTDPSRIQINATVPAPTSPCNTQLAQQGRFNLTLLGSYDRTTGAVTVSGRPLNYPGTNFFYADTGQAVNVPLFGTKEAWLNLQNGLINLHAMVTGTTAADALLTGTDPTNLTGSNGTFTYTAENVVLLNSTTNCDPTTGVFGTFPVTNGFLSINNWRAVASVPGPSALAIFLPGLTAGLITLRGRRRPRR